MHTFQITVTYHRTEDSEEVEDVIPVEQAGFRPSRSCRDQALTSYIEKSLDGSQKSGAVFVDLSAAYDTVWNHGLLAKVSLIIPGTGTF